MKKPLELTVHIDGAARGNPGPAAFAFVFLHDDEALLEESGVIGTATNNVAEYTALIKALERAKELRATSLLIRSDSELLVRQMNGDYRVKNPSLAALHQTASQLVGDFDSVRFSHVPRSENREADRLCNEALNEAARGSGGPKGQDRQAGKRPATQKAVPNPGPAGAKRDTGSSWPATLAEAERRLREAALVWAESGLDKPTPHEVLTGIVKLLEEGGFLRR